MPERLEGKYHITMVLPMWTVENTLTLHPGPEGQLDGTLDTGTETANFTGGRWNKNYFQIDLAVGPGKLQLTGMVNGDELTGVVVIDRTPDRLSGTRAPN